VQISVSRTNALVAITPVRGVVLPMIRERGWLLAVVVLATLDVVVWAMGARIFSPTLGADFQIHVDAAHRWLATGSPYHAWQLAGPYELGVATPDPILYPPWIMPLFVAFLVLPGVLWWAIPLTITAVAVARRRPTRLQVIVIGLLFAWPQSVIILAVGNPAMWMMAALALGTYKPAWAPLVFLKPSLFPLTFWNAHRGSWWIGLGILIVAAIPFGHLWGEWATAIHNARQSQGLFYSVYQVPFLLIPLVPLIRDPRRRTAGGAPRSVEADMLTGGDRAPCAIS
jgi:hypothetical protein